MSEPTLFEILGGEAGIARLVDRFYAHMQTLPEASGILAMHEDIDRAREKLWMFLVGRFGGPALYLERYGHPRLRARHMPFEIGDSEAAQWVTCMDLALDECVEDEALRGQLHGFFAQVAEHMRNRST